MNNTLEIGVYVFLYLIEQHSKFLLHTLQVLYMCTLFDSTNINRWWSDATRLATSFSRCNPIWFLSVGLRQGSGLCSSSSRKYPGTEGTNKNRHWNHHRWHTTKSLEQTRLSCWCLYNHKGCTCRAPIRYVTKTWSVVLLNKKKYIYSYLKCIVYDKLLKLRQSFRITLYFPIWKLLTSFLCIFYFNIHVSHI